MEPQRSESAAPQAQRHSGAYSEVQWYSDAQSTVNAGAVEKTSIASQDTAKAGHINPDEPLHNQTSTNATDHLPQDGTRRRSLQDTEKIDDKEIGRQPREGASSSYDYSADGSGLVADDDVVIRDLEKAEERGAKAQPTEKPDPNLIEWDGPDDSENPMNWTLARKVLSTGALATLTLVITFASSVFSTATVVVAREYGVSNEVTILGTSLFVLVCAAALGINAKKN